MSQTLVKELCPAASRSTRYSGRPDIRSQARTMPGWIGTTVSAVEGHHLVDHEGDVPRAVVGGDGDGIGRAGQRIERCVPGVIGRGDDEPVAGQGLHKEPRLEANAAVAVEKTTRGDEPRAAWGSARTPGSARLVPARSRDAVGAFERPPAGYQMSTASVRSARAGSIIWTVLRPTGRARGRREAR